MILSFSPTMPLNLISATIVKPPFVLILQVLGAECRYCAAVLLNSSPPLESLPVSGLYTGLLDAMSCETPTPLPVFPSLHSHAVTCVEPFDAVMVDHVCESQAQEHVLQRVAACPSWYVPVWHSSQPVAPVELVNLPAAQDVHA